MGVEEEGEEEGAKRQRSSPPQVVPCRDFAPLTIAPPPSSASTHPSSLTLSQLSPLHLPPVSSPSPSLYSSYNFPTSSSSGFPTSSPSLLSTFPTSSPSLPSTALPWTLTPPQTPQTPQTPQPFHFTFPTQTFHFPQTLQDDQMSHQRKLLPKPSPSSSHPLAPSHYSHPYGQAPHRAPQPPQAPVPPSPQPPSHLTYLMEKSLGSVRRWRENGSTIQVFYCAVCAMMLDTEERVVRHITSRHGEEAGEEGEGRGGGEEGERCRGCAAG